MPSKNDHMLLLCGLVVSIVGLVGVFTFGATDKSRTAIDLWHWALLVGAVLQLPFAMNLRHNALAALAAVLMTVGLISTVGMCMLDFVFWALPDPDLRGAVAGELMETPSIWQVFMLYGSEEVLYAGYVLAGLTVWKQSWLPAAAIFAGAALAIGGPSWFNVAGACCVAAGFALWFRLGPQARTASAT